MIRFHAFGSMLASQDNLCPVCDKPIQPNESTGSVNGRAAHVECWIKRREETRRPPHN